MFHLVVSLASRFLYIQNVFQGLAHRILALRSLDIISSHLTLTLPTPPPLQLLDAPAPIQKPIISPHPSAGPFVIESQPPAFSSPITSYQFSFISVTPSQFLQFLPIFVVLVAISGFVIIVPEIVYFFKNVHKKPSAFTNASNYIAKLSRSKSSFRLLPASLPSQMASSKLPVSLISLLLLWTGPPAIASFFTFIWFISILFSYEQSSNMIVTTLQWCGLLNVQDTRTPPLLNIVYEEITRGAAEYDDLVTINSVGHSPLADQLSGHTRDVQTAQTCRKNQEPAPSRPISNKSVDSQSGLHQQLEVSRAREQRLHADLSAAQKERDSLKALISTLEASQREQQRWEKIAEAATARHAEAEAIASKRALDLSAAVDRISDVQEQLRDQKRLVSRKDTAVQSITRKSRLAQTKLKWAEYKITRLDEKLREERDRRVRETKDLMHEQVMLQGRHRSEIRRLRQEAEDALRDASLQSLLDRDHPRRQPPTPTTSYDTGQGSHLPERILASGTLPARSATNPDSSSRPTGQSPRLPNQDELDYTARLVAPWLEIPSFFDMESEVAKESRAALEEMIKLMRQVDPPVTKVVKPNEHEKVVRLQEELVVTKERLRLSEDEAREVQRQLEQSKETLREAETQVMTLEFELKICQGTLREAQDAQHASDVKFAEADRLLRLREAESESSMARAEESELKCSQAGFLCAALQERVSELEEQVEKLKSAPKHPAITEAHTESRSLCPTESHTDLEGTTHNPADMQDSDSIYMIVSLSVPRLVDLSLPPSLSSSDSFYLSHQKRSAALPASAGSSLFRASHTAPSDSEPIAHNADADSIYMTFAPSFPRILDFSLPPSPSPSRTSSLDFLYQKCLTTRSTSCPAESDLDVIAPNSVLRPSLEDFSLAPFELPRAFLSKGNSFGSMDWPPIGSSLFPGDGNARNDQVPEARSVISDVDRESPSCAPIWTPDSPPSLASSTDERRVEVSLRLDREESHPSQQDCSIAISAATGASLHLPSPPRICYLASPIFSRICFPPFSFPHDDHRAERSGLFNPAVVTSNGTSSEHSVPGEFVPSSGWVDPKWQVPDFVASRKRSCEKSSQQEFILKLPEIPGNATCQC